jgi:hypothetical protein
MKEFVAGLKVGVATEMQPILHTSFPRVDNPLPTSRQAKATS